MLRRFLLAVVLLAGAAGPVAAGLVEAREAVLRAREAGAKERSPYEYYCAKAYLELAEHAEINGDAHQVTLWCRKAVERATQAMRPATEADE